MAVDLPLAQMSVNDKLEAMELLWADLSSNPHRAGAALHWSARHPWGISYFVCHGCTCVPRLFAMSDNTASVDVSLGRQGRLVIPAQLRRSLGLEEADRLVARQEANRLVLEKPEQIKQRLKERFFQVPAERNLVDELIADRREECRREGEG